jgi:hypothetical protein
MAALTLIFILDALLDQLAGWFVCPHKVVPGEIALSMAQFLSFDEHSINHIRGRLIRIRLVKRTNLYLGNSIQSEPYIREDLFSPD